MSARNSRLTVASLLLAATSMALGAAADPLREGFANPPDSARPRVWWHWMNGNVTQDGIAKDLAWLKQIGVGGVQNFDANLATPQIVDQRLVYMTEPWKDALRFAVQRAESLGLEFAIAASPGWSETGGPWVPPADGLKKVVWSEVTVKGGKRISMQLPAPPAVSGPFQDLPTVDELASLQGVSAPVQPGFYRDIAVLAFPVAGSIDEVPQASTDGGLALDSAALADSALQPAVSVPRGSPQSPTCVVLRYSAPRVVRTATLFLEGGAPMFGDRQFTPVLEAFSDGVWRQVAVLELMSSPTTVSFAPVTAQQFRVVLRPYGGPRRRTPSEGMQGLAVSAQTKPVETPVQIAVLRLGSAPLIHRFESKAGFSIAADYYALAAPADADGRGVPVAQVQDLTARMKANGGLDWMPPPGHWRIVRLGWSLLGTTNHPAPPEATGLEVDKFDGTAVRRYLQTYLGMYRQAVGDAQFGAQGLRAVLTDSIEVGAANWTPQFIQQFSRLRGYDPTRWLPTLTGVIVESRQRSDAFLYDYRRTLSDLIASEHYGTVAAVAHEHGLKVYGEALEDHRPSLGDDMAMRAYADTPMAALWSWNRGYEPRSTFLGDMKGASSVAHVYGRPYVAAESMTSLNSPWAFAPSDLRRIIDLEFAYGINRPVIHTSVHQPVDDKVPGLSLSIFGQYFNRHESWSSMARPWIDYLSRTSYLLQQGRNVADVAYFYGEEQPLTALYGSALLADVPQQNAFDFVNVQIVRELLRVEKGELLTPGGARYRVLYLGGSSHHMTLPVLRRIAELARAGATVVGTAPIATPALADDPVAFAALVKQLWSGAAQTAIGRGRIIATRDVNAALAMIGVGADFKATSAASDGQLLFVHRQLEGGDVYFVNNRRNEGQQVEARFRVSGRQPQLWRADTGSIEPLSYRTEGAVTVVPLTLEPEDSFFVVFREPATQAAVTVLRTEPQILQYLQDAWDVSFQSGRGAPATAHFDTLHSYTTQADSGIRYFSGIAAYTNSFELPGSVQPGEALLLDLGTVGDMAEVTVNGKAVGTVWHAPYVLDIGTATQAGSNSVQIRVANLWVNRLIGDAQPGANRVTYTALPTYSAQAALRPSGLMGPVRLLRPAAATLAASDDVTCHTVTTAGKAQPYCGTPQQWQEFERRAAVLNTEFTCRMSWLQGRQCMTAAQWKQQERLIEDRYQAVHMGDMARDAAAQMPRRDNWIQPIAPLPPPEQSK